MFEVLYKLQNNVKTSGFGEMRIVKLHIAELRVAQILSMKDHHVMSDAHSRTLCKATNIVDSLILL